MRMRLGTRGTQRIIPRHRCPDKAIECRRNVLNYDAINFQNPAGEAFDEPVLGGAMLSNTTEIGTALRPLRRVTRPARTAVSPRAPRHTGLACPGRHPGSQPSRLRCSSPWPRAPIPVAFALAVLAVLATLAPQQAAAQTETTFISNTGQRTNSASNVVRATAFTTGTGTYTLSSVAIYIGVSSGSPTPVVQIYGNTGSDPGTLVATMTNPATLVERALNVFTAPANTTLAGGTTYWVVTSSSANNFGTGFQVDISSSTNLDSGTATGWSIGNGCYKTDIRFASWTNTTSRHKFQIRGTAETPTNNPPTVANAIPDQTATAGTAFS